MSTSLLYNGSGTILRRQVYREVKGRPGSPPGITHRERRAKKQIDHLAYMKERIRIDRLLWLLSDVPRILSFMEAGFL